MTGRSPWLLLVAFIVLGTTLSTIQVSLFLYINDIQLLFNVGLQETLL